MKTNLRSFISVLAVSLALPAMAADDSAKNSSNSTPTPTATPTSQASSFSSGTESWDPFVDMARMQNEMNTFFRHAMDEFNANPALQTLHTEPGYSSTLDVRDKGDHYEVNVSLPNAESDNVKVTSEGNRALRVTASQSEEQNKTGKNSSQSTTEFGLYEQLVALPGPARTKQMKIERKNHELLITIPKATA